MDLKEIKNKIASESIDIACKERFYISSVFLPLIQFEDGIYILFEKRANNIRQGGEISFPGGGFDDKHDKNLKDTAIRETSEELGIAKSKIEVWDGLNKVVSLIGALVYTFIGHLTITSLKELSPNKKEVEEIFVLPLQYFLKNPPEIYHVYIEIKAEKNGEILFPVDKLGIPKRYEKKWQRPQKYPVYVYRTKFGTIWGITADILYDFTQKLNKS